MKLVSLFQFYVVYWLHVIPHNTSAFQSLLPQHPFDNSSRTIAYRTSSQCFLSCMSHNQLSLSKSGIHHTFSVLQISQTCFVNLLWNTTIPHINILYYINVTEHQTTAKKILEVFNFSSCRTFLSCLLKKLNNHFLWWEIISKQNFDTPHLIFPSGFQF